MSIEFGNITARIIQAEKFIGPIDESGSEGKIGLSASFEITASGFILTDQSDKTIKKLISVDQGDLVISDEDGSNPEIILDTSNQASSITKCDHLEISPDSNSGFKLLYIKDITGNTANIVDIQTDSSTDPVFKISSSGQTTITDIVLNTVDINGGTIDGTTIGTTSATSGAFTTITASTSLDVTGSTGIILQNDETITNSINGTVLINGIVSAGTGSASGVFKSNGDNDLTLQTGNDTTGSITITNGVDGNIAITPNGTGEVDISKVDIDSGTIDGTTIGTTSATSGAFTTITASTSATFNKLLLDVALITNNNNITNPDKSIYYFKTSGTLNFSDGTDGQVIHMFYNNAGSLTITFTDGLVSGSGDSNSSLTFNISGQSATVIFIDLKWRIINTGAIVG